MSYFRGFRTGAFCGLIFVFLAAGWGFEERAQKSNAQAQNKILTKENEMLREKIQNLKAQLHEVIEKSFASGRK